MRDLILDEIESLRRLDNFSRGTMRWGDFYIGPTGVHRVDRKTAKRNGFQHLSETNRKFFEQMPDDLLFVVHKMIARQDSKQM